ATYVVTQADIDNAQIDNVATVTGTSPDTSTVQDTDTNTVTTPQNPAIAVSKSLTGNADEDGSGDVTLGDTLTWTITATNTGDVTLTGVTTTDPLIGSLSCTPAAGSSLAPGDAQVCAGSLVVSAAQADAGSITNTGTASGGSPDGSPVMGNDSVTIPVIQDPALTLDKVDPTNDDADGSSDVSVGDTLTWTITATNTGNVTLSGVTVSDPFVGSLACTPANGTNLTAGATLGCVGSHLVTQADIDSGSVDNTATVTGTPPSGLDLLATDTTSTSIHQSPAIGLVKTWTGNDDADGSSDVSVGDTLTWTITATNTGNVTLTDVTVTDPLSDSISCLPVNGSDLAPAAALVCAADLLVTQAHIDGGDIDNTASVTAEGPGGDPDDPADDLTGTDTSTVPVTGTPDIIITTTHGGFAPGGDTDNSNDITHGDTITINYDVTN
ncbi:MAG: DUF11 domain-containing protein, partial [Actinomycetia bacterium]|nr:DUF11 domain-containing protein [Actinomycetes bacterium]